MKASPLLAAALALAAGPALAQATPLASVQLVERPATPSPAGLGADGPRAVLYFKRGSSAPGCGLLPRGGTQIAPLLEPDEGSDFPQCDGVTGAVRFAWQGRPVYVVRFLQRDTREDRGDSDAVFIDGPSGLAAPDAVDTGKRPRHRPLPAVAAWVKSQLATQGEAQAGFKPSPRDVAVTDGAFLAVSVDATGGRCRLTAGSLAQETPAAPVIAPCAALLATTGFANGDDAWFVALLQTPGQHPVARVLRVGPNGVAPEAGLDAALAPTAAAGKILPVRDALRKLVAAR